MSDLAIDVNHTKGANLKQRALGDLDRIANSAWLNLYEFLKDNGIDPDKHFDNSNGDHMATEDKLIRMYEEVHGLMQTHTGCSLVAYIHDEFDEHSSYTEDGVICMKDGQESWYIPKSNLLFDYLTKDWS